MNYFAIARGFIVTASADGTIPLNARIVCRIEEGNDALLHAMVTQANEAGLAAASVERCGAEAV